MAIEIKAPDFPESVADGTVSAWHKAPGDAVARDELLAEIETDKVVLEVVATDDGVMGEILKAEGDTVLSQEPIGYLNTGDGGAAQEAAIAAAGGDIKVPAFPETAGAATVSEWHKAVGDAIAAGDVIVDIETDKVMLQVVASEDAVLANILQEVGKTVASEEVIGTLGFAGSEAAGAVATGGATDIKAPTFPESVSDGTVSAWHKAVGETVSRDELLVEIETDKVVLEVVAPDDGVLSAITKAEGDTVLSEEVIGRFTSGDTASETVPSGESPVLSPAARQMAEENGIDPTVIPGTGKGGRITKEDVLNYIKNPPKQPVASAAITSQAAEPVATPQVANVGGRIEKRVPMTRLRARVAERLLDASRNTAMLTTFNEVNMQPVMELRSKYKEAFEKAHNGTKLGFMSFFVKASVEALKRFPVVNASIDGEDVVYHGYQDIGIAVSSDRGLVVPVLRDTEHLGLADIESAIRDFGVKAREGKLGIDELTGGTFTITNGGVFGSLMSTPILNPPQTAILGMHKIQERPMAVDGEVKILPMMYLALSYDHRLIDGKDAVQFLVAIKEMLEDPARILLEI
jgi:2-oxoglutarate dehydrogenase E2 component (dihydrolipoamide succinyltransferase)